MIYLIEMTPYSVVAGGEVTLRYGTAGYMTRPNDNPANAYFEPRVSDAGNYERFMFSSGRTRGESQIGGGDIQLINAEGSLDGLLNFAFDGRSITIYGLADAGAPWSSREVLFRGTMEQAEFPSRFVTVRIRDRLFLLRETLQKGTYLGTTTEGGRAEAEGNTDLKDAKKPRLFGTVPLFSPILVDQFDFVYQISDGPIASVNEVRDSGVLLDPAGDYPDLAAMKAADIPAAGYGTCLALGLIKLESIPDGVVTVSASEGATVSDRCVARVVQRMIGSVGIISTDDFDRFASDRPAECGIWIDTSETDTLSAIYTVLASVSGYLTVDRLGVFRVGVMSLATGLTGEVLLDRSNILLRGESLSREATSDIGSGVEAKSVTVRYAQAYTTLSVTDLKDVAATDDFRSFASEEWRKEKLESEQNALIHPKGPEPVFDTCLLRKQDAADEAARLMAFYGSRRDIFQIRVASDEAATLDLNDVVTLKVDRFGMSAGVPLRVIGLTATYADNVTVIEALG